jgi:hypothetical protein
VEGHDGLLGPRLDEDEEQAQQRADPDQAADLERAPVLGLLVREADEEGPDGNGEDGRPEVVEVA